MRSLIVSTVALAALAALAGPARAEWRTNIEYVASAKTQIRVLSSGGSYDANVGGKSDTTPAVFVVPNQDGYIPVEITHGSHPPYKTKLEVRKGHETKLSIAWVRRGGGGGGDGRPAPRGVRRIGTLKNLTYNCGKGYDVRFDIKEGNTLLLSRVVAAGTNLNNVELADGTYSMRVFKKTGDQFVFDTTATLAVSQDGWAGWTGCEKRVVTAAEHPGEVAFGCRTGGRYRLSVGGKQWMVTGSFREKLPAGNHAYKLEMFRPGGRGQLGGWLLARTGTVTVNGAWQIKICP